ncbi:MAG TPA: group 1 truncated hemoglobin [Kofleriaceae bacterium]|nr:group 1 truncated hemoglobin [Kofleriaceae bacterium]
MTRWLLALVTVAACGGRTTTPAPPAKPAGKPLYDRMGGMDVIDAVVKDFVEVRIAQDDRIRDRFKTADRAHLQMRLAEQICELSSGPCKYSGKHMRDAHAGIGIGDAELRVFLDDLRRSLETLRVPAREQDELLTALGKLHDEIVQAQ